MEKNNLNKVAKITVLFWIMKIIATTLGETLGDLLAHTLQLGYTVSLALTGAFFVLFLVLQLRAKTYIPFLYWLVIVGTTTVGTEISDFMDRTLHMGYLAGSLILITLLLNTLWIWHRTVGKIEVYPVTKRNVELFYWIAILFSNSLGTAFGDFLSDTAGLAYLQGALVTAGVIVIVVALHYVTKINYIILFWIAFIFTRPFGATFGDLLTKTTAEGGLDLGTIPATLVSIALLGILVIYSQKKNWFNMNTELLNKTEKYCKKLLQQGRCSQLQFHNYEHTAQVAKSANLIALEINVSATEREIILIAAYFHDVGNKEMTSGHEKLSCDIARAFLQKENFPEEKIKIVENIILSTEMGRMPTNLLEEIVKDADLSHLGMTTFMNRNRLLREEWANFLDRQFTDEEWTELNIQFLNEHHYYTDAAKKMYAHKKLKNLLKLKEAI